MDNAASIAATALNAFSTRQEVTANNIANVQTPDFKASSVRNETLQPGGVAAKAQQGKDPVDLSKEAVDLLANSTLYKANVATIRTADEMSKSLLDIKA
jgi:flagellar basal-body rod protein FlgC